MKILITGGCGFIGSHAIKEILSRESTEFIVNIDALTYSGQPENLIGIEDSRYRFVHGSINDRELMNTLLRDYEFDYVLNFAAESHVDRSIDSVAEFIETNIDGTRNILEAILKMESNGRKIHLIQISTDEVYGSLGDSEPEFIESTPLNPRNPYAVTKAASDLLVGSFVNTHGISASITRCSNNYGPNQFPEKLIPLMTLNAIEGKKLPIYGDGMQIRDWIHVSDHVKGVVALMDAVSDGTIESGEVFNFGASNELSNIEIVKKIIALTGASEDQIEYVRDRPGHDRRYAMGFAKAEQRLGWTPIVDWDRGLEETIGWYSKNDDWVNSVRTGEYRNWIDEHYG